MGPLFLAQSPPAPWSPPAPFPPLSFFHPPWKDTAAHAYQSSQWHLAGRARIVVGLFQTARRNSKKEKKWTGGLLLFFTIWPQGKNEHLTRRQLGGRDGAKNLELNLFFSGEWKGRTMQLFTSSSLDLFSFSFASNGRRFTCCSLFFDQRYGWGSRLSCGWI